MAIGQWSVNVGSVASGEGIVASESGREGAGGGRKAQNEANWRRSLVTCFQGVNVDEFGHAYAKRSQFRVVEEATLQEDGDRVRKGSGRPVMAGLRNLIIILRSFPGKASLARASRHDMCNLWRSVEQVSS